MTGTQVSATDLHTALRAWAEGVCPTEAGVELLIQHGKAIHNRAPWIVWHEQGGGTLPALASIDVDKLLWYSGEWSGGEQRVVRIAASLLGGPPVRLDDNLPGLDQANLMAVVTAVAQAGGMTRQ